MKKPGGPANVDALRVGTAQPVQREDWDRRHKLRECSLADALMMSAAAGAPLSAYLVAQLELAFQAYASGDCADLAEAFGMAAKKREKNAQVRETKRSNVRFQVEHFAALGFARSDPTYHEGTAFEKAAELLKMKASTVFDLYYARR